MSNTPITENLIKPNFDQVKQRWNELLLPYFDAQGNLKRECSVTSTCPHCRSEKLKDEFLIAGFRHVSCATCSSVYVTPRLKDEYLEKLYKDEYYSQVYGQSMLPAFETRKKTIGKNKQAQTVRHLPADFKGKVLDIGCGVGEVISVFKDEGWDCYATELNPVAAKWVESLGVKMFEGDLDTFASDLKFDVVMAWGVVEHVPDAVAFLKKAHSLLRLGGVFVSEVPHGEALLVDYCKKELKNPERIIQGEQHLILYSCPAYREIHEKAGLKLAHWQTNGLDLSTILRMEGKKYDPETLFAMQDAVDRSMKGDLLRGFWKKSDT